MKTTKPKKLMTVSVYHTDKKILLALKKKGLGTGRYNGFGGKVEKGESIKESAIRETKEEGGIDVIKIKRMGVVEAESTEREEILIVYIFKIIKFSGEPKESDEMKPKWFNINKIPFAKMWPDDRHWIPLFLKGEKFKLKILFGKNDKVLDLNLKKLKKY